MKYLIGLFLFYSFCFHAMAGNPHHAPINIILTPTPISDEEVNVVNYNNDACSLAAVAGASGQHNYQDGESMKWSLGGSYLMGECDNSALSFGLKQEFGDVDGSVKYSTDFDNSSINFNFNGSF